MDRTERVQLALSGQKADRIPRYEIFLDDFKQLFRKHHSLPDDYDPYDWYDRVDIGTVLADQRGPFYRHEQVLSDDGQATVSKDSWGRRLYLSRQAFFERVEDVVLKEKRLLDQLVFDDPAAAEKYETIKKSAVHARKRFAPVCGILGLFMGSYRMRGEMDYLMDLAEDPTFCMVLAERLAEYLTVVGIQLAEVTQTKETAIWVYDEFSSTQGPLFSPDTFAHVFYPYYRKMIAIWRAYGIRHVVLHCDGNCMPLLDMLLDAGFDGLQGIAPSTGMWLPDVKKTYGSKLALIGGMDNIHTLTHGSPADIINQTEALIEAAQDGGVILGTHSIDRDVSVDRYDCYARYLGEHDALSCIEQDGISNEPTT
ncbi:MAG: uroporphyrinogen decarboxylase family protein [Bacillota bacterium]|nr:uroporphyrinogen decarboxylase family protein [Bacillota bacterium]